jgi:hypothetical protein
LRKADGSTRSCIDTAGTADAFLDGLPVAAAFARRGARSRGAFVLTSRMAGFRTLRFFGDGAFSET